MAIRIGRSLFNGGALIESQISNLEGNNMTGLLNGGAPIESHISNLDVGDMSSSEGASTQQLSAVAVGKQKATTPSSDVRKKTKKGGKAAEPKKFKPRTEVQKIKHRAGSKKSHANQDDDLERLTDTMNSILATNKVVKGKRGKKYTRSVIRKMLAMLESEAGEEFVEYLKDKEKEKEVKEVEEDAEEDAMDVDDDPMGRIEALEADMVAVKAALDL